MELFQEVNMSPRMMALEKQVREMVEVQKLQQHKVAEILGIHHASVKRICKYFCIKTQRVGPRDGAGHTNWKGGVKIVKGYRYIYSPDHPFRTKSKYVSEHRSEEHTSELQSHHDLVCRLLLEKKKK